MKVIDFDKDRLQAIARVNMQCKLNPVSIRMDKADTMVAEVLLQTAGVLSTLSGALGSTGRFEHDHRLQIAAEIVTDIAGQLIEGIKSKGA